MIRLASSSSTGRDGAQRGRPEAEPPRPKQCGSAAGEASAGRLVAARDWSARARARPRRDGGAPPARSGAWLPPRDAARFLLALARFGRRRAPRVRAPRARRAPWLRFRRACALPLAFTGARRARGSAPRALPRSGCAGRRRSDGRCAGGCAGAAARFGCGRRAGCGARDRGCAPACRAAAPFARRRAARRPMHAALHLLDHDRLGAAVRKALAHDARSTGRFSDSVFVGEHAQRLVAGVFGLTHQSCVPGLAPIRNPLSRLVGRSDDRPDSGAHGRHSFVSTQEIRKAEPFDRSSISARAHARANRRVLAETGSDRRAKSFHIGSGACEPEAGSGPAVRLGRPIHRQFAATPRKASLAAPGAALHVSHLPAPMPNPIARIANSADPRPCVSCAESPPQSLPQLAVAVGAAVAGVDQSRDAPACDRCLDLGRSPPRPAPPCWRSTGPAGIAFASKPFDLSRADSPGATTFSLKPRAKACFLTASATSRCARRTQTPRPGNFRLMSGDDRVVGSEHEADHVLRRAFASA